MRLFYFILFSTCLLAVFIFGSCKNKEQKSGCSKDTDCKGKRICKSGRCVYPVEHKKVVDITPKNKPTNKQSIPKSPNLNPNQTPGVQPPIPNLPNLNLNKFMPNFNMKMKFKFNMGKDKYSLRFKGIKKGHPVLEMCSKGKCEDMSMKDPKFIKKFMSIMLKAGNANNPMNKLLQNMVKNFNVMKPQPGNPLQPSQPSLGTKGKLKPYRSVEEILKDKSEAINSEAIISKVKPVQVSDNSITFKNRNNFTLKIKVPKQLRPSLPLLAKTKVPIIIRFEILKVNNKYITGKLSEVEIPK
ncbi:MAG: hypothetical protein PF689_12075 [Deltaproteobacteria bacterium]|jgi:hypothetical protein|nr:hypothetical protein [Deltaproteobacteria bacterium]